MKLTTIIQAGLLSSGTILGLSIPSKNPPSTLARRSRLSNRLKTLFPSIPTDDRPTSVSWRSTWGGAILRGAGYRSVVGTVTVPSVKLPLGASQSAVHAVSAWVGIDGEKACPNAVLQVGVDAYINHTVPSYWAWIEWYPNQSTYLRGFPIQPGDEITLNATALSLSTATWSVTNHRTGMSQSAKLEDQAPLLCGFTAEWIVEDFFTSDGVPLAQFESIPFTGAKFATDTGITGGLENAEIDVVREIEDGQVVIGCEKTGVDGVKCSYRGGGHP